MHSLHSMQVYLFAKLGGGCCNGSSGHVYFELDTEVKNCRQVLKLERLPPKAHAREDRITMTMLRKDISHARRHRRHKFVILQRSQRSQCSHVYHVCKLSSIAFRMEGCADKVVVDTIMIVTNIYICAYMYIIYTCICHTPQSSNGVIVTRYAFVNKTCCFVRQSPESWPSQWLMRGMVMIWVQHVSFLPEEIVKESYPTIIQFDQFEI